MNRKILTIDGPAGTGKSTVAKNVAEKLGMPYFDTGAMYRAVSYLIIQKKIALSDDNKIGELMHSFRFEVRDKNGEKKYFANGQEITQEIRSEAVNKIVSPVSALPTVREALWAIQRKFAKSKGGVFEGRDMGTVVFPKAGVKIFLTARPEVRAQRRLNEILHKRPHEAQAMDEGKMLSELQKRDAYDASRQLAPLKCPEDAYVIDTSDLSIDQVVASILEYVEKKNLSPAWMHWKGVKFLYRIVLFFAWAAAKIFYRHKVYGLGHFYPKGAIIAANHTSYLDPPLLAISWPEEVHFLARETLFRNPVFGKFISAINAHPVSGDATDIGVFRTICNLLSDGKKVILFPEGKRSEDGQLGEIKPGIGMLVARTKTAIIPAYLKGPYEIWGRKRKLPKIFGKTICVFGSPIRWESYAHLDKKEAQEAVAKKFIESVGALKKWVDDGACGTPP
jgi:cytidylate kinase